MPVEVRDIAWRWPWPAWLAPLLVACAAAWIITLYAKEPPYVRRSVRAALAALRLVSLALLATMLAQPTAERSRVARPRLVVAVDRSNSMETRDVPATQLGGSPGDAAHLSRTDAWRTLLNRRDRSFIDRLQQRFDVDLVQFDAGVEAASLEKAILQDPINSGSPIERGRATRLGDAIDFALRQLPGPRPSAIIVISDGINTAGLSLADATVRAQALGVPIFPVAVGSDRPRPDVAVDEVRAEPVAFPGDRMQVEVVVRASGYPGRRQRIVLRQIAGGDSLAESEFVLPEAEGSTTTLLPLRPAQPGTLQLVVEAEAQAGEENTANNRQALTIEVRQQPIRTLLASAAPSFEYRALKSLLERDPAIALRAWLQDADPSYPDVDPAALAALPNSEAALLQFDVIILGDVNPALIGGDAWDNLRQFVAVHGGGLALVAGPRFMPAAMGEVEAMRRLMPIELRKDQPFGATAAGAGDGHAKFSIVPTAVGLQNAALQIGDDPARSAEIWAQLPPVTWIYPLFAAKPGAQVLAEARTADPALPAASSPAILRQYAGVGEVIMHLTDESWRWRWRSDDRYFARYWGQTVRRLARGRAMRGSGSLTADRTEYVAGDDVTLYARLGPLVQQSASSGAETAEVLLTGESSPSRTIELSRSGSQLHSFQAVVRGLPPDRYEARLIRAGQAPLKAQFTISAPPAELSNLVVNTAGMAALAEATGGRCYTLATAGRLPAELPTPVGRVVERLPAEPLWNSPWLLGALCGTLACEWLLRRRSGMV
ncbi:MAG: hypothetical protein IT424_07990 [Pirellulales bacterium]|nr:hypothetical protein [Pirellulales bacterium]